MCVICTLSQFFAKIAPKIWYRRWVPLLDTRKIFYLCFWNVKGFNENSVGENDADGGNLLHLLHMRRNLKEVSVI